MSSTIMKPSASLKFNEPGSVPYAPLPTAARKIFQPSSRKEARYRHEEEKKKKTKKTKKKEKEEVEDGDKGASRVSSTTTTVSQVDRRATAHKISTSPATLHRPREGPTGLFTSTSPRSWRRERIPLNQSFYLGPESVSSSSSETVKRIKPGAKSTKADGFLQSTVTTVLISPLTIGLESGSVAQSPSASQVGQKRQRSEDDDETEQPTKPPYRPARKQPMTSTPADQVWANNETTPPPQWLDRAHITLLEVCNNEAFLDESIREASAVLRASRERFRRSEEETRRDRERLKKLCQVKQELESNRTEALDNLRQAVVSSYFGCSAVLCSHS